MKYFILLLSLSVLSACQLSSSVNSGSENKYEAEIRWTSYGIPHVKATSWRNLGYGYAYATAEDAVCVIADEIMLLSGEQSKHQGPGEGRLENDVFHRTFINKDVLKKHAEGQSQNSKDFNQGYVKGYNRYLTDHVGKLPASCQGKSWVRAISEIDVERMIIGAQIRYGLGLFKQGIVAADPQVAVEDSPPTVFSPLSGIGSNGVALGRDVTASGRGMLLGNPHYPWRGPSRFHMIHLTIPEELDVMGVSLMTMTRILIGFNRDIAWTHTVSAALRTNVYELKLNPNNDMQYLFENTYRDIESIDVEVELVDSNGLLSKEIHKTYSSHLGPMIVTKEFPWNREKAYAIRDPNLLNNRHDETYDALNKAKNIEEVEAAISRQGIALTNTLAADRSGTAFYADISVTPNIDAEQLKQCRISLPDVPEYFVVMKGERAYCEWKSDERAHIPNVMPAEDMPRIRRNDYVTNSNDSYWLANPNEPLEGFSPTIGKVHTERSLRTRAGLTFVQELISAGKVQPTDLLGMLYANRNYAAELLLDDVFRICTPENKSIADACEVLKAWDRTMTIDSRGSQVWNEFWNVAGNKENIYSVAFDDKDPVNTPRGIALDNPDVRLGLVSALEHAQDKLRDAEIGLDQPLREIQYTTHNGERIPISGGRGGLGMYSLTQAPLQKGLGYTPVLGGNSYIQLVSWDKEGTLNAKGLITYSQSQEADSAHASDMTRLFSEGGWIEFPFTNEEINADPELRVLNLQE